MIGGPLGSGGAPLGVRGYCEPELVCMTALDKWGACELDELLDELFVTALAGVTATEESAGVVDGATAAAYSLLLIMPFWTRILASRALASCGEAA